MEQAITSPTPTGASTVTKALDILFQLREARSPQGVTSLARALGLQKSGTHRLLVALKTRGLVEQTAQGTYTLGLGLVSLAAAAAAGNPLTQAAATALRELASITGETVFLVGERAGALTVLAMAEGTGFLRAAPRIGDSIPPKQTAVGKLYRVHDPNGAISSLPRLSANARNEIRSQGFATNEEEWQPGLSVLAVPLYVAGKFRGALALATVTQRMALLSKKRMVSLLTSSAQSIQDRLEGNLTQSASDS